MKRIILAFLFLLLALPEAWSQAGTMVYSLPRTTVCLTVEAQCEHFTAGPYAAFAQKYLGVAARTKSESTCTLLSVTLTPCVEADPATRFAISVPERSSVTFLRLCSQGLIAMADNYTGKSADWRFTSQAGAERFEGIDPLGNLGREKTTLYKAVRTDEGYERVPVTQDNVVEKSPDRKAADAAATIFSLREKRQQIITGDTDATFSGEALQAAVDEITRLEERYLTLFYGISETSVEVKHFDVTPSAGNKDQRYTALRVGSQGLLPASAQEGKPVTVEFVAEPLASPEASTSDRSKEVLVHFRIPVITHCRVNYDGNLLLEDRVPVYQLGEESTLPLNSLLIR